MSSFLRNLVRRLAPGREQTTDVSLAAFGKHPGWDDHVELGVDTDNEATVRRVLYVEGIGGNIESGAWDKLGDDQKLARFNHVFLWQLNGSVMAGRLWSSSDGKGRGRYPMVVCAECGAAPIRWIAAKVFPVLAKVEELFTATTSATDARRDMDVARNELRYLAANGKAGLQEPTDCRSVLSPLLNRPELDRKGLLAIFYQIEGELGGSHPLRRTEEHTSLLPDRALHLRVPVCGTPEESLMVWTRFLQGQLGRDLSILSLAPLQEKWVDLIVGAPMPSHLYAIRALPKVIPLTTDIPYTFEPEFLARVEPFLESCSGPSQR